MKKTFLAAVLCIAAIPALAEDVTAAFNKCATTKDDRARLACYDKLRDDILKANTPVAANAKGYTSISLADLKVDMKQMIGKKIAVGAGAQTIGDQTLIKSDELDMNPLFASSEKLPRDDRKKLANGCQMVVCRGTFYGTIRQLPLGPGITLEQVEWR